MVKKNEKQVIQPDTCAKCKRGRFISVSKDNPRVVYCIFLINILLRIVKETVFMRINIKTIWLVDLPNKG